MAFTCLFYRLCIVAYVTPWGEAPTQVARLLHVDDLWLIAEVQSLLNSSKLQEPVNGHVVQAVCIKMRKMNLCACEKNKIS